MLLTHESNEKVLALLQLKTFFDGQKGLDSKAAAVRLGDQLAQLEREAIYERAFWKKMKGKLLDAIEEKALSSGGDQGGGHTIPAQLARGILAKAQLYAPLRQYCTVVTLDSGDSLLLPAEKTRPSVRWVDERSVHSVMSGLSFRGESIPVHIENTTISVTRKLLEDAKNFQEWLINNSILTAMLEEEAKRFLIGDGVGKPEGILSHPDVVIVNSGNASALTADGIIALYQKLPQVFRTNARWLMNSLTMQAVAGLKDSAGAPILRSTATGDVILGRPVLEDPNMPDIASNTFPIVLGDLSNFWIVDREPLKALTDPYTDKPNVVFDCTRRVGGQVVDPAAFVKQKISV